jgi:hypothetical protein
MKNILKISINGVQNHLCFETCANKTHYVAPNGMVVCPMELITIVTGMNIRNIIP